MGDKVEHVIMSTIEVDMSDETLEFVEFLMKETGFTMDKVVEYSLANMFLKEAAAKYPLRKKLRKLTQDSEDMGLDF